MTFNEFFSLAGDSERVFLPIEELDRFLPTCCAMANGAGGWIVLGAALKEDGLPVLTGVGDAVSLEKQLTVFLQDEHLGGVSLVSYFRTLSDVDKKNKKGEKILAARVEPAGWRLRPVCVGKSKHSYRRVEGENVISSREFRWRMALDALEVSRDDASVPGLAMSDLDGESVASFRNKLVAGFPRWEALSMENFLKRALILDECGGVTRAGELLLGENSNLIRLSLRDAREVWLIPNLWSACELLPQLSDGLTDACAEALRECFVNAMLHAEHAAGVIDVEFGDGRAFFSNPGLPRSLKQGESETRNYRLMRIFVTIGLAQGAGRGLGIIREYDANFRLFCDMLRLATVSELPLSAKTGALEPEKTILPNPGWLPVVQEKLIVPAVAPVENLKMEIPKKEAMETEFVEIETLETPPIVPEPYAVDDVNVIDKGSSEAEAPGDDEYLGTDDDDDEIFSPLVRAVRDTPRMSLTVVRDAILELCAEYKSIPELASALARSENSLRRHYITSMVKEGLLEMEFPDRVGHPDQRYRGKL